MAHRSELSAVGDDRRLARFVAAFASIGAALVHMSTLAAHLQEWWLAGLFFITIAAFQLAWAGPALLWASLRVLRVGVLVNAGTIAVWAVSRTVGLPFGPNAGVPEPVSRIDLAAGVLEVVVCAAALWCLHRHRERPFRTVAGYLAPAGTSVLAIAALTTAALIGPAGGHTHTHVANSGHHGPKPSGSPGSQSPGITSQGGAGGDGHDAHSH